MEAHYHVYVIITVVTVSAVFHNVIKLIALMNFECVHFNLQHVLLSNGYVNPRFFPVRINFCIIQENRKARTVAACRF